MVAMRFARLAVHRMTREPLALLVEEGRDGSGDRCLVVSVRGPQAEVIDRGPRAPDAGDDDRLTQDLLAELAGLLGRQLDRGEIVDLVDDRFRAELVLDVAVREGLRIEVADAVLDAVGQSFSELGGDRPEPAREAAEQVEEMRAFLEQATAQDFGRPPDGGEGREQGRESG
jgi:bifunctional DNase/RNase